MDTIFSKKILSKTVGLFSLFLLASCASPNQMATITPINAPYKRTIELTVKHPQLQSVIEQRLLKNKNYILQPQTGFSEFHIIAETSIEAIKTLETKPLLMGHIQKTKTPVNLNVHYKINNHNNLILAQGHFKETTETLARVYPSIHLSSKVDPTSLSNLADKIMKEAKAHISVTPWSTRVTSIKDDNHVVIAVGEPAGLELGDTFITESQPTSKLQVVMFEQTPSGTGRTVLSLMEGFLPQAGRKLISLK